ncbi:hypothetical protein Leryth_016502 [Lithospermum erythrorhizon]|nr:hypothetical protein Leryth_016502 [Lithospermum erythrorhizon]
MMAFLEIGTQDNKAVDQENNKHDKLIGTLITDEVMKPSSARPMRKRKGVHRFPIDLVPRRSATKKIVVYQGYGTPLKDIPNVSFKLSKRKTDNNLVLLHVILFGKKGKAPMVKKNLGLFSGFLWVEEEEKQRSKVRKKLDQCVKAKLLDFCNILDIPVNKATVKKEDLSSMLLKFLESPHPTTETLLYDKEKTRKLKQNYRVGVKRQQSTVEEEDKKSESSIGEDHLQEESDDEEGNDSEEDREDEHAPHMEKRTVVRKINTKENGKTQVEGHSAKSPKATSRKRSSCSSSKEGTSEAETESKASVIKKPKVEKKRNKISESETESKSSSVKKLNVRNEKNRGQNASVRKTSSKINASSKPPAKAKTIGQGKTRKKERAGVTGEEMRTALADILKNVDLNTATLADILGQLRAHFNIDLSHRKAEVKALITDIINKMLDEDDEPDTGNDADNEDDNDTYYD